jgi:squalene-hopene/tetraprenyl-beta-curcumene cyclase
MPVDPTRLQRCYETARDALLAERNAAGHWVGDLSTSALSTATAVMALELMRRAGRRQPPGASDEQRGLDHRKDRGADAAPLAGLITNGIRWLAEHQNDDGGWGDTTKSISNISTTMLCRASLHAVWGTRSASSDATRGASRPHSDEQYADVARRADAYIENAGGVDAVLKRYGKDRTFSIPILTHCALAGLVDWKDVLPLPFYLACLPAKFYKTVRLPVVSYALPALIAIGQVGFHFRKPWNPISRLLKRLAIEPSLRVLERIQPSNGGFLEAAPLTSFVTMSLAGMGRADHPVAKKGLQFLIDSVRPDGSWPIDTNLATWVTTLSVNALGDDLPEAGRPAIRDWLLNQQYKEIHPYTNADPGGWAWTDLPGGVPDGDDTPGAMLALMQLARLEVGGRRSEPTQAEDLSSDDDSLKNAIRWLLSLQNRDGGFPTFCRGWGTLPFDRSSPDITAHAIRALAGHMTACGKPYDWTGGAGYLQWLGRLFAIWNTIDKGFRFLRRSQRPDGSWLPLWFGNQHAPDDVNPVYGTARVLAALRDCGLFDTPEARRGLEFLAGNQNPDGGWGGVQGTPSSVEETALAVEILLADNPQADGVQRGLQWLCDRVENQVPGVEADSGSRLSTLDSRPSWREPAPIGFYFARLWYFERLYPMIFTVAALRRACQTLQSGSHSETPAEESTRTTDR